ncbi:MAG: UbiA family prenyltransferase [Chitinophagales bacterium]|nr:UbiA family prenyltransferase [Chitinophagales bacterium]
MKAIFYQLSVVSRSRDWRLSFVPFIMGCVYLWLSWFAIELNSSSVFLVLLSLLTTVGFAALGYFINEYFDIASDARAGKVNKLAYLPVLLRVGLFLAALALAFVPWCWLPVNGVSWFLIGLQLLFFLLYSLPFPRLKEVPVVSNFIDAGYAYWIPLLLSHHTYALYAQKEWAYWMPLFSMAVFLIGFRNILIHQVNDVFNDRRAGMQTLPMHLGVDATTFLIKILLFHEVLFLTGVLVMIGIALPLHFAIVLVYIVAVSYKVWTNRVQFASPYFSIERTRHITDDVNQYVLPLSWLSILVLRHVGFIFLVPLHLLFLFPTAYLITAWTAVLLYCKAFWWWWVRFVTVTVRHGFSMCINYPIYLFMKLIGVDLAKEKMSLLEYCKKKFSSR